MFKPEMMDRFHCDDFEKLPFKDSFPLKKAWVTFVYKILPLVNEEWGRILKEPHIRDKPNVYDYTSLSDEVFARWVIKCKYPKLKEEQRNGWPERDTEKKGKKEGPHESRTLLQMYCQEYEEKKKAFDYDNEEERKRKQAHWNSIFWEGLVERMPQLFQGKEEKKKVVKTELLNLPGMDEDW